MKGQTFAGSTEAGQTFAGPAGAEAGPRLSPNSAVWPRIGRAHCLEAVVHCAARELQKKTFRDLKTENAKLEQSLID